jgi:hypothetical protein
MTSVACAIGPSCYHVLNWFFSFQNLIFWNLFEFSASKITSKTVSPPHSESKSYQINFIKSLLIEIFPTTPEGTYQFIRNFHSYDLILIFSEEIIQYSRTFCTTSPNAMEPKPMQPSLLRAFSQRHQEHDLKHPGSVNLITTKQKQTTFLHR